MEPPVAPWPPMTPRAATAGANAGVTAPATSRMSLRASAPAPPSAGSVGALRPLAENARDPRKLASSMSPPFTAVSQPGSVPGPTSPRLRPNPRHISSPRTSSRPARLTDSLSQSGGSSAPGSAPASLSVTWDSVSPDDGADPAMSTLSGEDKATFMRRYFFTERGYETDRMPSQKHFDVLMNDAAPEFAGDHLYCRYVDFMREGKEQP
eukprot:COSAG06_NODE_861_length_11897_cov_4.482878_9_plen_208_part_01